METTALRSKKKMTGRLTCVGAGISIGAHISPITRTTIQSADIVFAASSDSLFEAWLSELHPNVKSLQKYYASGKSRKSTYSEMVDAILEPVRSGKHVVAAFYGHPGVFVNPSHKAVQRAKNEGFDAKMLPAISAEDCLYADLGIDPGKYGCQHFETTQFMLYHRTIDTSAYLILWQPMAAGDLTHTQLTSNSHYLEVLTEVLEDFYSGEHVVFLYKAATNVLQQTKINEVRINEIPASEICMQTTLVIPPYTTLKLNEKIKAKLESARKKEINII